MQGKLDTSFKAVLSSKNPLECSNAILDFAGLLTANDIEDLKKNKDKSPLGGVVFKSGLFNINGSPLSPEAKPGTLEWIENAAKTDIILWINQTLRQYLADRFGRDAVLERKDRAIEHMELWDSLNRELNSFFTMYYPLLAKTLEPSRDGTDSLKKDLVDTVKRAGTSAIQGTPASPGHLLKDTSRRLGLERKYIAAAFRALRFDYSDNRLVAMAKKASAVPPSLQERFWGTGFIQPAVRADYESLIRTICEIGELIRREKFDLAEEKIQAIGDDFLKTALSLLNQGNDILTIEKILGIRKETLLSNTSLLHDICLKGVLGIQNGYSPGTIQEMKPGNSGTTEYPCGEEIVTSFVYFSEKARREGLLALEDDIWAHSPTNDAESAGDDENTAPGEGLLETEYMKDGSDGEFISPENDVDSISGNGDGLECESAEYSVAAPERMNDFIIRGMKLVINGTDPEIVRNFLRDEADRRLSLFGTLHTMMIEGTLSVQCGDNPRILEEKLASHIYSGVEVDAAFERLSRLASKARKKGLFSIDEDIGPGDTDFLAFLLRLAINNVSPDIIGETAYEASARILEDTTTYCDFCTTAARYLYKSIDPSETDLAAGIPFYGSDFPGLFSSERERLKPGLKEMRAALLSSGKTRIPAAVAFPLLAAKDEGLWDSFFVFREALREKCSLLSIYRLFNDTDIPISDPVTVVIRAIENAAAGTSTLNSSLSSVAAWAKNIERSVPKNIAGYEAALIGLDELVKRFETALEKETDANSTTVFIEDLPSMLSANERSELRGRIAEILSRAERSMHSAVTALMKKQGIKPLKDFSGSYGSFADIVREYSVFDFAVRMRLMRDLADTYGKNSASPAGDCFLFDDILLFDDMTVIKTLSQVDTQDLAIALKNADDSLRIKIYSVMSENAAELLREDIEFMGKVGKEDSSRMSWKIARVIWRLYSEGELEQPEEADVLPGNYSAILDFVLELIPLIAGERNRSIRRKHGEMMELLKGIEKKHGINIPKTVNDWNHLPEWEITPAASGETFESEEKIILVEIAQDEANDYIRALMPEDILHRLDFSYPISSFDELGLLADWSAARIICAAPHAVIRTALKGAKAETSRKILSILPGDLRGIMEEELTLITPSNVQIEQARGEIMKLVMNSAQCGELSLAED